MALRRLGLCALPVVRSRVYGSLSRSLSASVSNAYRQEQGSRSWSGRHFFRRTDRAIITHSQTARGLVNLTSPFPDVDIPEKSLPDFVQQDWHEYPERIALINGHTGAEYTYGQVQRLVRSLATNLQRHGLGQTDTVMFVSSNNPEYIIMFLAVLTTGAAVSPANTQYNTEELAKQFDQSRSTYMYTDLDHLDKAGQAVSESDNFKELFVLGDCEDHTTFKDLTQDEGHSFQPVNIDPKQHVAIVPFSSGTTGLPKGVMLTHYGMVANSCETGTDEMICPKHGLVQIAMLPYFHMAGIAFYIAMGASWGHTMITFNGFEPDTFLQTIKHHKVSFLVLVPPLAVFLDKYPQTKNYDLSSLKRILVGAAPTGPDTIQNLQNLLSDCKIGQVYGLTETSPVVSMCPLADCESHPGSSGTAVRNTEIKLMQPQTGQQCSPGENGEIWVRGPQVMKGYLDNPTATRDTMDTDGWLHTGDIAYYDKKGHLYIVDRLKELIKFKGFQVAPAELEALLLTHPAVRDAGVFGVADDRAGELPRAFVVLKPGRQVEPADIVQFVKEKAAPHKRLSGGVRIVDEIPKTASGKILRRRLRELNDL